MEKWISRNLSETQGFECLGHSNWTICSLLSQSRFLIFPTSTSLYRKAQFLFPHREDRAGAENGKRDLLQSTCIIEKLEN